MRTWEGVTNPDRCVETVLKKCRTHRRRLVRILGKRLVVVDDRSSELSL